MKKLERRIAYYDNGKIVEGKTNRKTFDTDGLVGIVALYSDGTREQETIEGLQPRTAEESTQSKIARLMIEANLQFKHDGGITPEIKELRRKARMER